MVNNLHRKKYNDDDKRMEKQRQFYLDSYYNVEVLNNSLDLDGFLHCRAKIARIGIQEYNFDGITHREYRSEAEVIKSLESFRNKPLTFGHPGEFVNSSNAKCYGVGFVSDVKYKDGWLIGDVTVTDIDVITQIQQGNYKYFSCGYLATVKEKTGNWRDSYGVMGKVNEVYTYTSEQSNIYGNHIALSQNPRAGLQATFCKDSNSESNKLDSSNFKTNINLELLNKPRMIKITRKGEELELDSKEAQIIYDELDSQVEILEGKLDALVLEKSLLESKKTQVEILEGKLDALELEKSLLESKNTQVTDSNEQELAARVQLWSELAAKFDSSEVDYTLPSVEIKRMYLKKLHPTLSKRITDGSDSYVNSFYDFHTINYLETTKDAMQNCQQISDTKDDLVSQYRQAQELYIKSRTSKEV